MGVRYSIVIPTLNHFSGVQAVLIQLEKLSLDMEIILVDDGGKPNEWEQIKTLTATFPLKKARFTRNFGQHAALQAGFSIAEGDYVITLDDDHAEIVPVIKNLIAANESLPKLIYYGSFEVRRSFLRSLFTALYRWISGFMGQYHGKGSSVRLLHKTLYKAIAMENTQALFVDERIRWYTDDLGFCDLQVSLTKNRSRYGLSNLFALAAGKSFYATDKPLKWIARLGAWIAFVNALIAVFVLYKKYVHKIEVEGYTSLIVSILFSTGVLMFSLGVIAIYIRKILLKLNHAPAFLIQETLS